MGADEIAVPTRADEIADVMGVDKKRQPPFYGVSRGALTQGVRRNFILLL